MPYYLIAWDIADAASKGEFFNKIAKFGESCRITSTTAMLSAHFEIEEIIEGASQSLSESDVLFVLDLETLEVDGANVPPCLEEFLISVDESPEEDDEFDEDYEENEEDEEDEDYDDDDEDFGDEEEKVSKW